MKLFYSPASPYARKVLAVAHEKGLIGKIQLVQAPVTPVTRNADVSGANPLGKVPTLVLDDGRSLFDSRVISAYLDAMGPLPRLVPEDGGARFTALTLEALADGLLDAALLHRYENHLRPAELRWQEWSDGQMAKILGALDQLEARWISTLNGPISVGVIAAGCAIGYLDFRFADLNWRSTRPRLARAAAEIAERPSLRATRPA